MSYDLDFKAPCCGANTDSINITYNLQPMMFEAGVGVSEHLEGKTGAEVALLITKALIDMQLNRDKYTKLNPPNGWGSYESLIEALTRLREVAECNPTYILGS